MPMNLEAVGAVSKPGRNSWASKDALLYALGLGYYWFRAHGQIERAAPEELTAAHDNG